MVQEIDVGVPPLPLQLDRYIYSTAAHCRLEPSCIYVERLGPEFFRCCNTERGGLQAAVPDAEIWDIWIVEKVGIRKMLESFHRFYTSYMKRLR